jgi:hypothetical protein
LASNVELIPTPTQRSTQNTIVAGLAANSSTQEPADQHVDQHDRGQGGQDRPRSAISG